MKPYLMLSLAAMLAGEMAIAQTKAKKPAAPATSETLTNASIIDLNKAGLGDEVIIAKIESSAVNFDLSANGLIALKTQKVDSEIIKAMMQKSSGKPVAATLSPGKTALVPVMAANTVPDIKAVNLVYSYNKAAGKATPLEKVTAAVKFKKKMFGYGGMDILLAAAGTSSPTRLQSSEAMQFLMNVPGNAPDMILYRLTVTKEGRQAISQKLKAMSTDMKPDDNMVPFITENVKPNLYQFTLSAPLAKGEYFFIVKPANNPSTIDAYAFGID